jgi:mRNA interferase RelE/StbE
MYPAPVIAYCDFIFDMIIAICDVLRVQIAFTAAATRQWLNLTADVRRRLDAKLSVYAQTGQGDVKRLRGRDGARLRVGDWRVIFYVEDDTIIVAAVGHRREIYD